MSDRQPPSDGKAADPRPWTQPEPGDVLGSYRVLELIAVGGMALVYAAQHLRIQRQVALKLLKPEFATLAREVRRFLEEARAANEIHHPRIVEIHDFVESEETSPPLIYMVLELLRGRTLASLIDARQPFDERRALNIAGQVAEALEHVHGARLLHRDLKSSNIYLVESPDPAPLVKLLDFGLTLPFGERQQLRLTDPGTSLGTPEYMSPEHILGRELDARSDIYALGVVLYEMLAGSRPFRDHPGTAVLVAQVETIPEPVNARRPGCPIDERLQAVVMRCLEKDPARRFPTAAALHAALADCAAALPDPQAPPAMADGQRRRPRRRIRASILVAALLLLVAAGIFLYLAAPWGGTRLPAVQPSRTARYDAAASPVVAPGPDTPSSPATTFDLRERRDDAAVGAPSADLGPRRPSKKPSRKQLKRDPGGPTIDPWKL